LILVLRPGRSLLHTGQVSRVTKES
jgi:hypothetical protein